jgi:hypothetical protein
MCGRLQRARAGRLLEGADLGGHWNGHLVAMDGGAGAVAQGLTLVHFSAQLERLVWDRGCA